MPRDGARQDEDDVQANTPELASVDAGSDDQVYHRQLDYRALRTVKLCVRRATLQQGQDGNRRDPQYSSRDHSPFHFEEERRVGRGSAV